jgi:hypothetical protein
MMKTLKIIHILKSTEFFYIFNNNIFTHFRHMIKDICDCCLNHIENHKILNKECGCKICIDCAKKEVNHISLNNFEKNYVFKNIFILINLNDIIVI